MLPSLARSTGPASDPPSSSPCPGRIGRVGRPCVRSPGRAATPPPAWPPPSPCTGVVSPPRGRAHPPQATIDTFRFRHENQAFEDAFDTPEQWEHLQATMPRYARWSSAATSSHGARPDNRTGALARRPTWSPASSGSPTGSPPRCSTGACSSLHPRTEPRCRDDRPSRIAEPPVCRSRTCRSDRRFRLRRRLLSTESVHDERDSAPRGPRPGDDLARRGGGLDLHPVVDHEHAITGLQVVGPRAQPEGPISVVGRRGTVEPAIAVGEWTRILAPRPAPDRG